MIIDKFNVSISDWFIFFKFNFEFMWVPILIIIALFTITINIEVVLSILLTILLVLIIFFFRDVFLTGKECNLNLNFGYLEIKMPKMISFYLNKLPRSMRNYRDQKIFFKDIEEVMLLQKSNRFRGEYTQISIKLKSENEIVLGNIINHEFAVEIKNIINKIFKNEIDLKNGLLKCP